MQEDIPIPQKAKKVFRRPSPEPQMNTNPQPFRSNSPPLPAVLKKMKEDGIEYIPPRSNPASAGADRLEVESVQGVKPATAEDEAHNITSRRNSLKPASARHSRMESRSKVRDTFAADDGSANRQLLEQLEAIQRELQSEDEKVRKDIQNATTEAVLEYDKNRFETELDEINIEINKDEHLKKWQPEVDYKRKPLAPRQAKPVHFQRYRDIVTPKSVTYTPPVYNFDRSNQLSAETELVSITKNIQR